MNLSERMVKQELPRRHFLLWVWGASMVALAGQAGLALVSFFKPFIEPGSFGGQVNAGRIEEFRLGSITHIHQGRFYLSRLDEGVLAMWQRCTHLGCTVPWRPEFSYEGDKGWYRCPCHGSTYTLAGVRVFGPAPRSMDTMEIEVDDAGNITVQTGRLLSGGPDNPQRAIQAPGLPS